MGRVCVFVSSVWAGGGKKKRLTYHFHKRRVSACDNHSDWQVRRAVYASKDTCVFLGGFFMLICCRKSIAWT